MSLQSRGFSFAVIKSRHTNVTVIFLPPYRVVPTLIPEPECRRSLFLERVQSELSQRNSDFHLANPLRILWRRDVIAPRGSPMRTWGLAAATPQRFSIFCARIISIRFTSLAT